MKKNGKKLPDIQHNVDHLNQLMGNATGCLVNIQMTMGKLLEVYASAESELKDINRILGNEDGNEVADLRKLQSLMSMNVRTVRALSVNARRIHSMKNMNVIVS